MQIDRSIVEHIAKLANLELQESEIELFARQLQQILTYVDQLNEVQENVEPFSISELIPGRMRPDEVVKSLPIEDVLKNAPESVQRFFRVPRIIP
jgi:aspartyl-tRNA(Asn)/glutamyl-tRNA(Gln) amidotransferase subunit C